MGQHLATLIGTLALSGCSLIYNPSNLPSQTADSSIDTPIADADPSMLMLKEVKSPVLLEGAGQGGSQPQILVVYGSNITKQAMITLTGSTAVHLDNTTIAIADDGNSFAALVRADYMDAANETDPMKVDPIPLTITVEQPGAPAPVPIGWTLKPLDQILASNPTFVPAAAGKMYSHIDISTGVGIISTPGAANKAILRAVGNINVSMAVTADADSSTFKPGAGGCAGGAANAAGACFGGGQSGGGGGGFATTGGNNSSNAGAGSASGAPYIPIYDGMDDAMNRGGGGGGGGLKGGGGGGVVELTAGGNLNVKTVSANGSDGESATLSLTGGGGGAGGTIVLRAGAMLTMPTGVTFAGGAKGTGLLGSGGVGSIGRWRFDAAAVTGTTTTMTAGPKRGPMIVRPANPIVEKAEDYMIMVTGNNGDDYQLLITYPNTQIATGMVHMGADMQTYTLTSKLAVGLNKLCILVPGGNSANDEAQNCIEVAFIP